MAALAWANFVAGSLLPCGGVVGAGTVGPPTGILVVGVAVAPAGAVVAVGAFGAVVAVGADGAVVAVGAFVTVGGADVGVEVGTLVGVLVGGADVGVEVGVVVSPSPPRPFSSPVPLSPVEETEKSSIPSSVDSCSSLGAADCASASSETSAG